MESGLVDADLGGGVVKMRIARKGQGKSGGFRVFLIVREAEWCVVYYGFAKSDAENIAPSELADLKRFAAHLLALSDEDRELFFKNKEYLEVK